jgi:Dockerin type I domain
MWNAIPIHLEALRFTAVQPLRAVSRKTHGPAGVFDVDLPLTGGTGIECRSGDYQIVVTFPANAGLGGATVTPGNGGTASVSGPPTVNGKNVTVNLTGVSTGQTLTVNLIGVTQGSNSDNVSIPMSILVGDTNEDRFTDAVDVTQTKSQSGKAVTYSNFREDVNADGFIDAVDAALVKSKSGTALP